MTYNLCPLLLAVVAGGAAVAQSLVADIRPGTENPGAAFVPERFVASGGRVYVAFQTFGPETTWEVWSTDGTSTGAQRLLLFRGNAFPVPSPDFTELPNGLVLFRGLSPSGAGVELHVTDGTAAGTAMVADLWPGSQQGVGAIWGTLGNRALFTGVDPVHGAELWSTDGTPAGTQLVVDLAPGITSSNAGEVLSAPSAVLYQGRYYFSAETASGAEPWVTDGTAAGTQQLADIDPTGYSYPSNFCVVGSTVLFAADDSVHGRELWRTDGTPAGTVLAADIAPGAIASSPARLRTVGSTCYFAANNGAVGTELWRSDGFTTTLVRDIHPAGSSSPRNLFDVNSTLVFTATDGVSGTELWRSDGTAAGTQLVVDLAPGAASTTFATGASAWLGVGSRVVFSASTGSLGLEPWVTDGTAAGTALLRDIRPGAGLGSTPNHFVAHASGAVFSADDGVHGRELWATDFTTAGTMLLHEFVPPAPLSSLIGEVTPFGGGIVFAAFDDVHGRELWRSDGTAAGTTLLGDLLPGSASSFPRELTVFAGKLLFAANGTGGPELWVSDGTPAGTDVLLEIVPGLAGSNPGHFTEWRGALYFAAGDSGARRLWRTDGTAAGTVQVAANVVIASGSVSPLIPLSQSLIVKSSTELYRYDPAAGAVLLPALGVLWGAPSVVVDDRVYFIGMAAGVHANALWRTDGTPAGTTQVHTFGSAVVYGGSGPFLMARLGDRVLVTTADTDPTFGNELWISDGTPAGTTLLRDISPGPWSTSMPLDLTTVPGRVLFTATDGVHGRELWSTDGTTAGTTMVVDFAPGADGALAASDLVAAGVGRRAVIAAWTPATGAELAITDGTAAGTQHLFDLLPGVGGGAAGFREDAFVQAGANVFFGAYDALAGFELHVMPAALLEPAEAERIGSGCSGSAGVPVIGHTGVPALGDATFGLVVTGALAVTPAVLAAATTRTDVPLPGGCTVYPTLPAITLTTVTSAAGEGTIGVPVPSTPALVGAELFCQWAALDAGGAFANLLAFSDALRIRIGRS